MNTKSIRLRLGMSQAVFARMLQCGEQTVINWELGKHSPSAVFIREIHRVIEEVEQSRREEKEND